MNQERVLHHPENRGEYQVRQEIQYELARLASGVQEGMERNERNRLVLLWVTDHAESFASAWEEMVKQHLNILEDYNRNPESIRQEIIERMFIKERRKIH
jgi:hypothetical protein